MCVCVCVFCLVNAFHNKITRLIQFSNLMYLQAFKIFLRENQV